MTYADVLTIELHDGAREEFRHVEYILERDLVRVRGGDGAELLVIAAFDVADLQAVRKGQCR